MSNHELNTLSFEIIVLLKPSGILLAFATVLLQIAVFLQPLLPEQYQIAPVCELISQVSRSRISLQESIAQSPHENHSSSAHHDGTHLDAAVHQHSTEHHHDINHQCQYCTIYGNLLLPPSFDLKEILVRIQVRLLAYSQNFKHVYFELQRLYLLPQGRAPPSTLQLFVI